MNSHAPIKHRKELLASLRQLDGRGTIGDVVGKTGFPNEDVRTGLRALLESHRGHLEVTDSGELVYRFDRRLIERAKVPVLEQLWSASKKLFTAAFKLWIMLMLAVYFVIFVALLIAALAKGSGGGRGGSGGWSGGERRHVDPCHL